MADFVYDCCKAEIVGFVGNKPDIKTTQNGKEFATFTVFTAKKINGERVSTTRNVVTFAKQWVEFARDIEKGARVRVLADVEHRTWNRDGVDVETVNYNVSPFDGYGIEVLPYEKKGSAGQTAPKTPKPAPKATKSAFDDEVPF